MPDKEILKFSDLRQSKNYTRYIENIGWEVDYFEDICLYVKKLFFWKFVKIQRPDKISVDKLVNYLNKNYKCSTVYIEPFDDKQYEQFSKGGFRKYNSPFLPSKTLQIDLTKSGNLLLKDMHYKTRYNIKSNIKNQNYKLVQSTDIEKFADFWQRCAKKRGMFISQRNEIIKIYEAFGKDAVIHVANKEQDDWLAAILRISTKEISYYMYAAATYEGKRLFAPTVLTWEAINSAKNEGKKLFDFEGIYDERFPLDSWKGFTRFKKGFGGEEIEYPGTLWKVMF